VARFGDPNTNGGAPARHGCLRPHIDFLDKQDETRQDLLFQCCHHYCNITAELQKTSLNSLLLFLAKSRETGLFFYVVMYFEHVFVFKYFLRQLDWKSHYSVSHTPISCCDWMRNMAHDLVMNRETSAARPPVMPHAISCICLN
jgi:hypothetical protein